MEQLAKDLLQRSISEVPYVESLVNCTGHDISVPVNGDDSPVTLPGEPGEKSRLLVAKRDVASFPLQRTLPSKERANASVIVVSVPGTCPLRLWLPEKALRPQCQGIIIPFEQALAIRGLTETQTKMLAGRSDDKSLERRVPVYYWAPGQGDTDTGALAFAFREV